MSDVFINNKNNYNQQIHCPHTIERLEACTESYLLQSGLHVTSELGHHWMLSGVHTTVKVKVPTSQAPYLQNVKNVINHLADTLFCKEASALTSISVRETSFLLWITAVDWANTHWGKGGRKTQGGSKTNLSSNSETRHGVTVSVGHGFQEPLSWIHPMITQGTVEASWCYAYAVSAHNLQTEFGSGVTASGQFTRPFGSRHRL
jgi:hypothetical protein